jgi:hypothetical protein
VRDLDCDFYAIRATAVRADGIGVYGKHAHLAAMPFNGGEMIRGC